MKKAFKLLFTLFIAAVLTAHVHAASASIKVTSGTSQVVVGNTFTVTVKVSSSSPLGAWEYTLNYDTSKFKLVSGENPVADPASNGSTKSKSYSYKFKAVGTGSGTIGVKSVGVIGWDKNSMSVSTSSKTVKVITQAQKEASYSKDNYLKSLSIDGLKLSPSFKKDTLEYTAEAGANTTSINIKASKNDSKASVSGAGKHNVGEGANVFKITVKAQNGSTRTYKVTVNVVDPNPIVVNMNDKEYYVVKRESSLTQPEGYEKTTVKINDMDIPAFYNETNNYTLVGLKDSEETKLYIYDSESNTYNEYFDVKLDELDLYPLEMDKEFGEDYTKSTIVIGNHTFSSLKLAYANYHILKARNLNTGKDNYYLYDEETNTAIRYNEEKKDDAIEPISKDTSKDLKDIVIILAGACSVMLFVTLFALLSRSKSKKQLKKLLNMIEEKQKQAEEKKKQKELEEVKEITEDENKDIKPKKENKKKVKKNKVN